MSRLYLLDSNTCRKLWDPRWPGHIEARARMSILQAPVLQSVVTRGEYWYGRHLNPDLPADYLQKITELSRSLAVLEITEDAAEYYGKLRAWLFNHRMPRPLRGKKKSLEQLRDPVSDERLGIQENDLWIVSQAIAAEAILVTTDKLTHIRQAIDGAGERLLVESW